MDGNFMFYVDVSGEMKKQIKDAFRDAVKEARGELFVDSLKEIHRRLTVDPAEFGEPLYQLPKLQLHIRGGAVLPVYVEYSISFDHPFVVIRRVKLMS